MLDIYDVPIPNAKVTLVPRDWMGEFWGETDSNGLYMVLAIQGVYTLTVTADGFIPYMEYPLNLMSSATQKDIVLKPVTPAP